MHHRSARPGRAIGDGASAAAQPEPEPRLAPDEAESAEAEAAVLAAGDVAGDAESAEALETPESAESTAAVLAAGVVAAEVAAEPKAAEPASEPAEPASEPAEAAEAEPEAPEPAATEAAEAEPGATEPAATEAAEAEPEAAEPQPEFTDVTEPEPGPEATEPGAAAGWFREAPLDVGGEVEEVEGVDLDGWPTVAATAAAVVTTEVEPEGPLVRERDRPVVSPLPAGEQPRRPSRLRRFLVGVATIVAVAVVGFVAGMMLPVIFPGPGIETGTASPSPAASSTPTAGPTATPEPPATPTAEPTATPTAEPTPAPTPLIHVVQPGDQLARIAARYGVTVAAIVEANDLADPNLIRVGQRLIIPLPSPSPVP